MRIRLVNENLHSTMSRTNCNRNFSIIFAKYNVCSNTEKKLHSFRSGIAEKIDLKRRSPRNVQQISRRPIYWWCVTVSVDIKSILHTVHAICMFTCFKGLFTILRTKVFEKIYYLAFVVCEITPPTFMNLEKKKNIYMYIFVCANTCFIYNNTIVTHQNNQF